MSLSDSLNVKSWQLYLLGIIILMSLGLKLYYDYYWPETTVKINGNTLKLLVADNPKHWERGLGKRKDLGEYSGMLFVFPEVSQHVFVMRDMLFPIDIVWLKKGMVVDIAPNVQIEPNKIEGEYLQYIARDTSNMVIELPAGRARDLNLKLGDIVNF